MKVRRKGVILLSVLACGGLTGVTENIVKAVPKVNIGGSGTTFELEDSLLDKAKEAPAANPEAKAEEDKKSKESEEEKAMREYKEAMKGKPDRYQDPFIGTARPEIESMIASILIVADQVTYGDTHPEMTRGHEATFPNPVKYLDCSGMVRYGFHAGIGVTTPNIWTGNIATIPGIKNMGQNSADVQRGDILNTSGHVEIALGINENGEVITVGSDGDMNEIAGPEGMGPMVEKWYDEGEPFTIYRLPEGIKEHLLQMKGAKESGMSLSLSGVSGGSSSSGSAGTSSGSSSVGGSYEGDDDSWKNPVVIFSDEEGKVDSTTASKGLKGNKNGGLLKLFFGN